MYKIENTTSDIKLIHPQHIANRFLKNDDTVKISGIILKKPYKLQITGVAKVKGKKKKRKKVLEYNCTLKNALDDALAKKTTWIQELKSELNNSTTTDMDKLKDTISTNQSTINSIILSMQTTLAEEIPQLALDLAKVTKLLEQKKLELQKLELQVKSGDAITEMMTLNEAFEMYVRSQHTKFKSKKISKEYDEYRYRGLYDKHIRKAIGCKFLDNIDKEDIQEITNNMFVSSRAVLDAEGNKIPMLDIDGKQMRYAVKKRGLMVM